MAIFFALLTLVGWGVGDVFITIASRKIGSIKAYFYGLVFTLILTSFYIPFAPKIEDMGMFVLAIALGALLVVGTLFYFKALEIGNASLVGAIGGSFIVPTIILSMIFFGEKISLAQAAGILMTLFGIISVSLKLDNLKIDKGIFFVILASSLWGVYYGFIRIPVESIGWFWTYYPTNFLFLPFLISARIRKGLFTTVKNKKTLMVILAFVVLIATAQFAYNLGILAGYTSVVVPIAGAYSVLFVILSRIVLRKN